MWFFVFVLFFFSLSLFKQPVQVHSNFFYTQFPGKLQNLEFVPFVKLYSMGIASNISVPASCVLTSASAALPLSVFPASRNQQLTSPLRYSVCHQICVVTWCYFYVKYLLGQYSCRKCEINVNNELQLFSSLEFIVCKETSKARAGKHVTV